MGRLVLVVGSIILVAGLSYAAESPPTVTPSNEVREEKKGEEKKAETQWDRLRKAGFRTDKFHTVTPSKKEVKP